MADIPHCSRLRRNHPSSVLDSRYTYTRDDCWSLGLWTLFGDADHYAGWMLCQYHGAIGEDGSAGIEVGIVVWGYGGAKSLRTGYLWL